MFFILSKTVALLLLPSNFLILLGLIGLALMVTRLRRAGLRLMIASVALLAFVGLFPVGAVLGHALESRFPPWNPARGAPDGIIVLGGAIFPELSRQYGQAVLNSDGERIVALVKLARTYPDARIIYSGGDASLRGNMTAETSYVGPLLDGFGIARGRVTLESRSRNTAENAAFSNEIARPKPGERWLLVTSAQHMPRAIGCFRRAGFTVEAYPVAWRSARSPSYWPGLGVGGNLARLDSAATEWIGLIAYWLTGRTSELLPSA